ncbi:hypothetical protein ACHWQZ_G016577 [Mnemiopsis leidyi]
MKIVYPLQDYRQTHVMTYLVAYLVGMVVTDAAILVPREWFSDEKWGRWIMDVAVIVCFWSYFTHCYAGILVSIPTVIHLYFSTRDSPTTTTIHKRGCVTILLINLPYFLFMATALTVWETVPNFLSFHLIAFSWIPIVTSSINPIIITSRRKEVRRFLIQNITTLFAKSHVKITG